MSLQLAAKHLASKGRGPDTQLVHMTMGELKSLQDLAKAHGGAITTNPDTGLPEAGFLKNILPIVAGAALAPFTGGASMAALLVGGGTALATGNLEKGLMAGLGAFGGAGLASGLMAAGAATPAAAVGEQALAATQAAQAGAANPFSTMGQGLKSVISDPAARSAFMTDVGAGKGLFKYGAASLAPMLMGGEDKGPPAAKPTPPTTPLQFAANPVTPTPQPDVPGYGGLGQDFGRQQRYFYPTYTPVASAPAGTTTQMPMMAVGGPVEAMSAANIYDMQNARGGVSDMGIDNSTGMQRMADGGTAETSGYEGYKGYSQPEQGQTKDIYKRDNGNSGGMADRTDSSVAVNPVTTIAIGQALQGYGNLAFAPGAAIASMLGHGMVSSGINALGAAESQAATDASNAAAASQANAGLDSAVDAGGEAMGMARGGISDLGDYSDGGRLLRGPGDGVSDSIPAMIGRKQPARLADGEFVVPARIVSELGNGSTEAGARKLYAMMDRVQRARGKTVGKGRVAKNTRADKYLPA